ncbi:MAG: hypothetical protein VCA12_07775 [Pseudomonadales bacterium]
MSVLGMVEIYQLLLFSSVAVLLYLYLVQQASTSLPLAAILLSVYAVAAICLPLHPVHFSGRNLPNSKPRNTKIFSAFRKAKAVDYLKMLLFKAPNLLVAVFTTSKS